MATKNVAPAIFIENRRKIEPKEILSCLIHYLLVIFAQQPEILLTTLSTGREPAYIEPEAP